MYVHRLILLVLASTAVRAIPRPQGSASGGSGGGGTIYDCLAGMMAPTFDDGPDPIKTMTLADSFSQAGAVATFFFLGSKVTEHPQIVQSVCAQGHTVGIHGFNHDHFGTLSYDDAYSQMARSKQAVVDAGCPEPRLMRFPYGEESAAANQAASALNLRVINWTVDPRDYDCGHGGHCVAQNLGNIAAQIDGMDAKATGPIILQHDDYSGSKDMTDGLLGMASERGLRVVSVATCVFGEEPAQPSWWPKDQIGMGMGNGMVTATGEHGKLSKKHKVKGSDGSYRAGLDGETGEWDNQGYDEEGTSAFLNQHAGSRMSAGAERAFSLQDPSGATDNAKPATGLCQLRSKYLM
ncbi:hypothetical protein IWQ60_003006 [Tieghemiomyces parasiticus]|uniref:NodB homology domain-containing protein n=1 Tax=Tieghemiomyces parasiticus TaxID=78921 RepID=A0A9W8E0K7_9FUNG|nr:hypothetical protein IWQ60_003006 [Tieghemiomyces parasiticus]